MNNFNSFLILILTEIDTHFQILIIFLANWNLNVKMTVRFVTYIWIKLIVNDFV